MTNLREAAQMALDALEWCYDVTEWPANGNSPQDKAIEALRARLAQPEPEPVAWWDGVGRFATAKEKDWDRRTGGILSFGRDIPLYTAPPQREWQGLTDEEIENFVQAVWPRKAVPADYIRAIEAKLKEKNT